MEGCDGEDPAECCDEVCQRLSHCVDRCDFNINALSSAGINCRNAYEKNFGTMITCPKIFPRILIRCLRSLIPGHAVSGNPLMRCIRSIRRQY